MAAKKKKKAKKSAKKKAVKRTTRKKATKKKATRRKATKKKTTKRKATKKKATKKKATRKKATKRKATKKKATRKKKATKKKGAKRKPNAAFMRPMELDAALSAVVGKKPLPRTQVTKKLWEYIKRKGLQDKTNRRMINADDALKKVFGGKKQVSMFEMTKLVNKHMK